MKLNTHDTILNFIERMVNDGYSESRINKIKGQMNKFLKYLSNNDELSALGNTMKNNIEEIMNEYGDSLTEQEKISVLIDIMKKYM